MIVPTDTIKPTGCTSPSSGIQTMDSSQPLGDSVSTKAKRLPIKKASLGAAQGRIQDLLVK
jgi:hypothetical protein